MAPTARLVVAGLLLATSSSLAGPPVFDWEGAAGIWWDDAENWMLDGEPVDDPPGCEPFFGVDAIVADPRKRTVRVRCPGGGDVTLASLTALTPISLEANLVLNDDSVLGDLFMTAQFAGLEVHGDVQHVGTLSVWDRGAITGTSELVNAGTLTVPESGLRSLRTRLRNTGTLVLSSGVSLDVGPGMPSNLTVTGLVVGDGSIGLGTGSSARLVVEGGTVRGSGGTFSIGAPVDVGGVLEAADASGLRLLRGASFDAGAVIRAGANGLVEILAQPGSEDYVVNGELALEGDGSILLQRPLDVLGNTVTVRTTGSDGSGFETVATTISLDGGLLVVEDFMRFHSGVLDGGLGTFAIAPGGTVRTPTTSTSRTLEAVEAIVDGALWHEGGTTLLMPDATVNVTSSGVLEHRAGTITGLGTLELRGDLIRPMDGANGIARVRTMIELFDGAQISNDFGTLQLTETSGQLPSIAHGGTILTAGDALTALDQVLELDGGELRLEGDGTLETGEPLIIASGATVRNLMTGDGPFSAGYSAGGIGGSGTIEGMGSLINEGLMEWDGADILLGAGSKDPLVGVRNESGGTFVADSSGNRLSGRLVNAGGTFRIETGFELFGGGRLVGESGTIDLVGGNLFGTDDSTVVIEGGATLRKPDLPETLHTDVRIPLRLEGDARVETDAASIELDETLELADGGIKTIRTASGAGMTMTLGVAGDPGATPQLRVEGQGTTTIRGDVTNVLVVESFGDLLLDRATFLDGARLIVNSGARWRSGSFVPGGEGGEPPSATVQNGILTLEGTANRTLHATLTVEDGYVDHVGGSLALGFTGEIAIEPPGGYVLHGNTSIDGVGVSEMDNRGGVQKLGSGLATIDTQYRVSTNARTVVTEGTLVIANDEEFVSDGALVSGTWEIEDAGVLVIPTPLLAVGSGATVRCEPPVLVGFPALASVEAIRGTVQASGIFSQPLMNLGSFAPGGDDVAAPQGVTNEVDPPQSVIGDMPGIVQLAAAEGAPPAYVADVLNRGRVAPGGAGAIGIVSVVGALEHQPGAITALELRDGATDAILVDGPVVLDGTLRLDALDGYVPTPGTTITVLEATGAVTGAFDDVVSPGLGAWTVSQDGGTVTATMQLPATCAGDVDADGVIGINELLAVLANWGFCPSCAGDVDGDDEIGLSDLLAVLAAWGDCGA